MGPPLPVLADLFPELAPSEVSSIPPNLLNSNQNRSNKEKSHVGAPLDIYHKDYIDWDRPMEDSTMSKDQLDLNEEHLQSSSFTNINNSMINNILHNKSVSQINKSIIDNNILTLKDRFTDSIQTYINKLPLSSNTQTIDLEDLGQLAKNLLNIIHRIDTS